MLIIISEITNRTQTFNLDPSQYYGLPTLLYFNPFAVQAKMTNHSGSQKS